MKHMVHLKKNLDMVVSTVTIRNENFLEMAQTKDGQKVTYGRFRVLEEIAF